MKRSQFIEIGDSVLHSGFYQEVLDIEIGTLFVTCIIPNGGRISYLAGDLVQIKNCDA